MIQMPGRTYCMLLRYTGSRHEVRVAGLPRAMSETERAILDDPDPKMAGKLHIEPPFQLGRSSLKLTASLLICGPHRRSSVWGEQYRSNEAVAAPTRGWRHLRRALQGGCLAWSLPAQ